MIAPDGTAIYPWNHGETLTAAALNAAIAQAAAASTSTVTSVLDFGADPTGAANSTAAFQAALATGQNVWAPKGTYRITGQLIVAGASQQLYGDGLGTVLLVDSGFDPTVTTGVIMLNGTMRPLVADLTIQFTQPQDLGRTTTAASATGTNTITVNNATGIVVGMSVVDRTQRPNAIPSPIYNTSANATTVIAIAGNVITLSANITSPGVASGDSIQFGAVRSMFKTLAAGGTATPGGTGIQYPWAIYSVANQVRVRRVMVIQAWNGIYIRGSSFQLDQIDMFAYNVGLDVDQCYNFCSIRDYVFYLYGMSVIGGPYDALNNVAYDGSAVAANLGECDGVGVHNFQSFIGKLNLTSTWTWGSFTNLMMDFNAKVSILSSSGGGYVQIANFYSTVSGFAHDIPFHLAPGTATFRVWIDNFYMTNSSVYPSIQIENGYLAIDNGYIWYGSAAGQPNIQANNGSLYLSELQFDGGVPAANVNFIALTNNAALTMDDCTFLFAPNVAGDGVAAAASNKVAFSNITWNGWSVSVPAAAWVRTDYSQISVESAIFAAWLPATTSYANDAAAATGGVAVGQLYRNGSAVMCRIT